MKQTVNTAVVTVVRCAVRILQSARAARALRLLLLFVLASAVVKYIFFSILDVSPPRTSLYIPGYVTAPPSAARRIENYTSMRKLVASILNVSSQPRQISQVTTVQNTTLNVTTTLESQFTNSSFNISSTVSIITSNVTEKSYMCPEMPSELGPIKMNNEIDNDLYAIDAQFPEVGWGGQYTPRNCLPRHKVAIIVPYRGRERHLPIFLNHMHPFLMKQQLEYGIFIVEQSGHSDFNKAKLMNVGFKESQKLKSGGWQCFIFHDIDLLPLDGRNLYSCPRQPRHMSSSIDEYNSLLQFPRQFGGVTAMTKEQFIKVNGFSNKYLGWGGEDDDMMIRLRKCNFHIGRYKMSIARYASLYHEKAIPNPKRHQLLAQTGNIYLKDGLTTLVYELVDIIEHHLFTHIIVNETLADG